STAFVAFGSKTPERIPFTRGAYPAVRRLAPISANSPMTMAGWSRRVVDQHRDAAGQWRTRRVGLTPVGHCQVGEPIAVEAAHGDRLGWAAGPAGERRLAGPVALAQQHRDARPSADRQIQRPVAVQVAHGDGYRSRTNSEVQWRPESPVAIAQQYRHV